MKDNIKRIDIIYIIGFLIILIGVYFNNLVVLSNHPLYTISSLFTPTVIQLFIWGGIAVIIGELILTKDIYKFQGLINIEFGSALLYVLLSIIIVRRLPSNIAVFFSVFLVLLFIILFIVIRSNFAYAVSLFPIGLYTSELLGMFHLVELPPVIYTILAFLVLTLLVYMLVKTVVQAIKKQPVLPNIVYLVIVLLLLGVGTLHDNIYDTSYRMSNGIQNDLLSAFCSPTEDIEDRLFWNVLGNDDITFPCNATEYGIAVHSEQASLYTYLLFLPLPVLSWGAYRYGRDVDYLPKKSKQTE